MVNPAMLVVPTLYPVKDALWKCRCSTTEEIVAKHSTDKIVANTNAKTSRAALLLMKEK